ncbi:type II toxin-antitoxin system RelE family toxin [Thalassobacterium maritimum]|uniref:type II toxin-antitoxin system RelE family toxin n=1 Tax=Thalassobacterium maritimum TaxID=3041265 RepID=UPI0031F3129B
MEEDLQGDVKKLTNHTPEYRMHSGNYRVLFEVEGERIVVYRVLHRKGSIHPQVIVKEEKRNLSYFPMKSFWPPRRTWRITKI